MTKQQLESFRKQAAEGWNEIEKRMEKVEDKDKDIDAVAVLPVESAPAVVANSISPDQLISKAIDNNVPVDVMERLLAMRTQLRAEQAKQAYDDAMAAFQSECPEIVKTKPVKTKAGKIAYKYAPIESIVSQVKDLLRRHGFSYAIRMKVEDNGSITSTCIVKHVGGHSEEYSMTVPLGTKTDVMSNTQVTAAASTFAKRYAFCNAFGIMTGDDDNDAAPDGESESHEATPKQKQYIAILCQQRGIDSEELIELAKKYNSPSKLIDYLKDIPTNAPGF